MRTEINNSADKGKKLIAMLKRRLNPVFLVFFIFPLCYYFLWISDKTESNQDIKQLDYMSFSVRVTNPAKLCLYENDKLITLWDVNKNGFKNLEYLGKLNCEGNFVIKVSNLNPNDTVTLLGINLYHDNQLFSLNNGINSNITLNNAQQTVNNGTINVIAAKNGIPVCIDLKSPLKWSKSEKPIPKKNLIAILFLLTFLLIIIINPSSRYFIISLVIGLFVLTITFLLVSNVNGKITLSASQKIRNAEIFYSQTPIFTQTKKYTSDNATDIFSVPLNLETEKYLRFDLGDSLIDLTKLKVKVSTGVFERSFDISTLRQDRLILNDMVMMGNTYHITGNDPYFKLADQYFINQIELLLFYEHNIFLIISLIVFVVLLSLNKLKLVEIKLIKFRLKPAYLAFLLILSSYYLIQHYWENSVVTQKPDFIYFSTSTSSPSVITLFNGNDSIASANVNSPAFKYIQFKGNYNLKDNFYLKIKNLSAGDTISFLSINLFHNNNVYSLFEKNNLACNLTNAQYTGQPDDFRIIVKNNFRPVVISLLPSNLLRNEDHKNLHQSINLIILLLTLFIIFFISPKSGYFIVSIITTSIMMVVFFWVCEDVTSNLSLSVGTTFSRADIFYNNTPDFNPKNSDLVEYKSNEFDFKISYYKYKFLRCDIGNNNQIIKNLHIKVNSGILSNNFDYNTLSSNQILLNDLKKDREGYCVYGNDPYITLTSSCQFNKISNTFLIRQHLYYFLSVLLLLILLFVRKYYKNAYTPNFFLVVVFLTFISCGFFVHPFNSEVAKLRSEHRGINKLPPFQLDSTDVFINGLEKYILDQMPGREDMIRMNTILQYSVFKQLINNQSLHFGDDGWIFYIGGLGRENYENRKPLTLHELNQIKDVLQKRNDWLNERGMKFYMIFPPTAQTIYEEFVGQRLRRHYKQTKTEQLLEYLKNYSNLKIIDVNTPLINAKKNFERPLYYKNHCHWSYYGGYIAYCTMINYIKNDFPNVGEPLKQNEFKWKVNSSLKPDLLEFMDIDMFYSFNPEIPVFDDHIITDTIFPFYDGIWTPKPPVCMLTCRTTNPKMLMYGDSFGGCFLPFLFRNFSKSVFIWTPLFRPDIIEKEKPDMVIQEMVDANILNILLKNKPFPPLQDSVNKP